MGSSASVCVNILKTLTTYLNRPLSKYALAERAFHVARNVLGRHIGKQDEYAAAFGGLNIITFEPNGAVAVTPINVDSGFLQDLQKNLLLFFVGSAHNSWTILEEQENSTRSHKGYALDALHEVRSLVDRMRLAIERSDLNAVGLLMDEAWMAKKRISNKISNERIDHLYDIAKQNGALGGKITGAGGGGFLLFCCDPAHQDSIRTALATEGVKEMAFGFDFQGAQVIVNDPFIDGDERAGSRWTFVPISATHS